jgi:hypothetical protein
MYSFNILAYSIIKIALTGLLLKSKRWYTSTPSNYAAIGTKKIPD